VVRRASFDFPLYRVVTSELHRGGEWREGESKWEWEPAITLPSRKGWASRGKPKYKKWRRNETGDPKRTRRERTLFLHVEGWRSYEDTRRKRTSSPRES